MVELVKGWEAILGIGVVVLILGLLVLFVAKKRPLGSLLGLTGILWLLAFGLYYGLAAAGLYAPGPYDPFVTPGLWIRTVAIGVVIFAVGIGIAYYAVRSSKRARGASL